MTTPGVVRLYYAATAIFLLLDLAAGINVRVAFFEGEPWLKLGYYLFCFACLGAAIRWPDMADTIGAAESLLAFTLLILSFGSQVMVPTARAAVTIPEVVNFVLAGGIAYVGWTSATAKLGRRH